MLPRWIMAATWLRCLANGGRWLLPWACVLMLSGAVAHTAGQAIVRIMPDQLAPPGLLAAPAARAVPSTTLNGVPANGPGSARQSHGEGDDSACLNANFACSLQVVKLSSVDAKGATTSLTCLTTADRVAASLPPSVTSADVLAVRANELDTLVSELCTQLWH